MADGGGASCMRAGAAACVLRVLCARIYEARSGRPVRRPGRDETTTNDRTGVQDQESGARARAGGVRPSACACPSGVRRQASVSHLRCH